MGLLVDGVWQQDGLAHQGRPFHPADHHVSATGSRPTAAPARPAKAALPPSPAAITSMSRSPAPGRTAPSSSASSKAWRTSSRMSIVSPDMLQGRLDLQQGRRLERRRGQRQEQIVGNLSARRSAIFRPRQRAGAVGQEAQDDRQQRVVRNHPHAQFGVRRLHQRAHRLLSGTAARRDRPHQRSRLSQRQQRRLSRGLRHRAGRL